MKTLLRACMLIMISLVPFLCSSAARAKSADEQTTEERQMNEVFDIANEEFKTAHYEDAARLYEGISSSFRIEHPDIYYNLGNANFKLGRYGKAIAAYRRALLLSPREQDALANLRLARSLTKDKLDSPKSTELLHDLFFFYYGMNRRESELVFLLTYLAAVSFGVIGLFWKARGVRGLALATLAAALVFCLSTLTHVYDKANPSQAVVTVEAANIHTGPGETYLTSFQLHDGAELEVRKELDDWRQVELSDGRRGWIRKSDIESV